MVIPKINSAHGSDTRNIINAAIDLINTQGKTIQDLVAEGQLTPTQYAQLISIVNGNVSKGSITAADIDKNNFKIDQTFLDESLLEQITGDAPINAVPADNSLTTNKFVDKAVTPEKVSFMESTRNLFDGNYLTGNISYPLSGSDVKISLLSTLRGSVAIVPIQANKTYTVKVHDVNISDELKVIVHNSEIPLNQSYAPVDRPIFRSATEKVYTFTNTSNGKFLAVQPSNTGEKHRLQIEEGSVATDYVSNKVIKDDYINIDKENEAEKIDDDLYKDIFENTFDRKKQGAEKSKITNLITPNSENLVSNTEIIKETNITKKHEQSLKINVNAGETIYIDRVIPEDEQIKSIHTLGMLVHLTNNHVSDVMNIQLTGESGETMTVRFSSNNLSLDGLEKNSGWNLLRYRIDYTDNIEKDVGKITKVRFLIKPSVDSTFIIDSIWAESFEKAKIIFIHDGGYQAFFNKDEPGYYDLEERQIPLTLAAIPYNIYDEENTRFISGDKLMELSLVNNNEISIHSYAGEEAIATNTPEQMYQESLNALSLLKEKGHEVLWRAAFFRNRAPGASGAIPLFDAFAFNTMYAMTEAVEGFPFVAPYNVRRFQLHQRTNETMDLWFEKLKRSRGVWVVYTHSVSEISTGDITNAQWQYFLNKLDVALAEGWMEGATFKSLMSAY